MQPEQISIHLIRPIDFVSKADRWVTAKDIATGAGVALRTASQHAKQLTQLGAFECTELFSGHRYRLAQMAPRSFLDRIDAARAAFNMEAAQ